MTFQLAKPSARMVAISRPRSATAEYIVLSAPNTAPMAMTTATKPAQHGDQLGHRRGLLGVVVDFALTSKFRRGSEVIESLNWSKAAGEVR